jgi:hypothetical protein
MAWKAASGERRCVHHSSRTGEQCRLWGVVGTEPPTCRTHGAAAPQVKAAAERRVANRKVLELAERIDVEVPEFTSAAQAMNYLVTRVTRRAAQFGNLADEYGQSLTYSDRGGTERLRASVVGEQRWLDSLAKVLAVVVAGETAAAAQASPAEDIARLAHAVSTAITNVIMRHPEWGPPAEVHAEITATVAATLRAWMGEHPEPDHPHAA